MPRTVGKGKWKVPPAAHDIQKNTQPANAEPRIVTVNIKNCLFATVAFTGLSFVTAPVAFAAPLEITRTTTTSGTVSEFGPGRIVIRSESEKLPLDYTYTKTTTYVDEAGAPVSMETVKSGLPVTVYYTRDGDRMIANKVVVRRMAPPEGGTIVQEKTTTTRTQSAGTLSDFGRDAFELRSETSSAPVRYLYSTKTTYVDENGAPVSVETVKSGLPVTVYYTREGDRMNAVKVIVHKAAPPVPAPAPDVIIQKKTTTVIEEKR